MALGAAMASHQASKSAMLAGDDKKRADQLEKKLEDSKKEIANRDQTIKAIQRNFEQLSTLVETDRLKLESTSKELREAKATIATLKNGQGDIEAIKKKFQDNKNALDVLSEKYAEAEKLLSQKGSAVKESLAEKAALNKKIELLTKTNVEIQKNFERMCTETVTLKDNLEAKTTEHKAAQAQIAKLQEALKQKELEGSSAVGGLASEKAALEGKLSSVQTELATCQGQLKDALSTVSARDTSLLGKDKDLRDKDGEIASMKEKVTSLTSEVSALKGQVKQLEGNGGEAKDQLEQARAAAAAATASAAADAAKAATDRTALQSEVQQLKTAIAKGESTILQLKDDLAKEATKVGEMHDRIARLTSELATSKRAAEEAEAEAKKKIAALTEEVANLTAGKAQSELVAKKEQELKNLIAKITHVEESTEGHLTCMACMELFKDAHVLSPCGHVYCKGCYEGTKDESVTGKPFCQECGEEGRVNAAIECEIIDQLAAKFTYKRTAWEALLKIGLHA